MRKLRKKTSTPERSKTLENVQLRNPEEEEFPLSSKQLSGDIGKKIEYAILQKLGERVS